MGDIKVHHPDGRVWYVRRRWARRRLPWAGRGRRAPLGRPDRHGAGADRGGPLARGDRGGPLLDLDEDLGALLALEVVSELVDSGVVTLLVAALAIVVVGVLVAGLVALAQATTTWLHTHPGVLVAGATALVAVALLVLANLLVGRPRLVIAERLGLEGAPMRVWRVVGRRRSRELAQRVAEAIRSGRIDSTGRLVTPTPGIPDAEAPDPHP